MGCQKFKNNLLLDFSWLLIRWSQHFILVIHSKVSTSLKFVSIIDCKAGINALKLSHIFDIWETLLINLWRMKNSKKHTTWKVSVFGVIMARIFQHLDWIRRDFRIQSKCGKIRTGITPNTDNFYAVAFRKLSWLHSMLNVI